MSVQYALLTPGGDPQSERRPDSRNECSDVPTVPVDLPLLGSATLSSESITFGPTEWQIDLVSAFGMVGVGALLRIMALVALLRRH